ncbi:MAG TPA: tetratricopeptide repeat protein [Candidatus Mucispirillum faecigallinarum]|uniref:Tetratricopeptide repeat protein n=1 Tax=Candidatus Mucispirillum faecigallinarum TaxID=2838699 RepID=A0A9D2GWC6_9BACT|nr:tetratricopeptide repeat protein [Candidatus Mucispirillum faecigallinarum]
MSLITDTLNKMKKEQGSGENDDKMMAPPALRNAVVNTKKYQEFVKNAEIKDIDGHKAPLKGFVIVSIILVAVIAVAAFVFLKKEDTALIHEAGIVSNSGQSASGSNQNNTASLGKPYGSAGQVNTQSNNTPAAAGNNQPSNNMQANNEQQTNNTGNNAVNNNSGNNAVFNDMAQLPESSKNMPVKNLDNNMKQGPADIIPANQLFVVFPKAPVNNQESPAVNQNNNAAPVENTQKPAVKTNIQEVKPVTNQQNEFTEFNKIDIDKAYKYTQQQVEAEQARAVKNAEEIEENLMMPQQKAAGSRGTNNYSAATDISDVKAIKSKDKSGTVSASTIALYNQYVTAGNNAKKEGSYEHAIEYYVNALALNKNDVLSANIANMYLELKNPNMAFQVTVKNGMVDTKLISSLILRMVNSKYFLESNKMLQYANTLEKSSYTLFANGYYEQAQGQFSDAVKYYKDAIQTNPADVSSAYYAAICYEELGQNNNAVEMYKYIVNSSSAPQNMKNQAAARIKKLGN